MLNTIASILLIVALGICIVAFPFVIWMLFADNGPRFRPMRHIVCAGENGTMDFSGWDEDRKKASPWYDGAGE
jgi:hypothetical protein